MCNLLDTINFKHNIVVITVAISLIPMFVSSASAQNMTSNPNDIVGIIQSAKDNVGAALSFSEGGIVRDAADRLHSADAQLDQALVLLGNRSLSQMENRTSPFDFDAPISDLAKSIARIHLDQAEEELDQVPPNRTGASIHFKLAGMNIDQIEDMIEGATLDEANKQKLMRAGIENCVVKADAVVDCLN
jgi:hypothetical protein